MGNKKILVILILAFVLLLGGAGVLYGKLTETTKSSQLSVEGTTEEEDSTDSENSTEEQKVQAPNFTVYDIDGNAVKLSDYAGKPIVLNFWASWCGPCQMEMPDFNEKYKELKDEVQFLMLNMTDGSRETVEIASEFVKEAGYEFPVFYDTKSEAATVYGAYSLPTTYFINAEGYIEARASGAIDAETLQTGIDMIKEE